MGLKLANNATSTLAADITNTATSLSVQTGDASLFPALSAGDWFPLTLKDASGNMEVVRATARSGAAITITRAQEGTSARAWSSGDRIDLRLTSAAIAAIDNSNGDSIHAATAKTTLADADEFSLWDSVSSAFRKITWPNFYEAMRTKLGAMVSSNSAKSTPVDADQLLLSDSASGNASSKLSWLNLKNGIWAALGALIAGGTNKATPVAADMVAIADSAASNATKYSTLTQVFAIFTATAANLLANANALLVTVSGIWSALGEVALTDAATIAVDMNTFVNASVTLAGNRTLGQPTNTKVGQTGRIKIVQDATGSRTLAYHADWKFAGGTAPTLSTGANKIDVLYYEVLAANYIYAALVKDVR